MQHTINRTHRYNTHILYNDLNEEILQVVHWQTATHGMKLAQLSHCSHCGPAPDGWRVFFVRGVALQNSWTLKQKALRDIEYPEGPGALSAPSVARGLLRRGF